MPKKKYNSLDEKAKNRLLAFVESTTELPKKQIAERLLMTRQLYKNLRSRDVAITPPFRLWQIKNEFGIADATYWRLTKLTAKEIAQHCTGYHLETEVGASRDSQ